MFSMEESEDYVPLCHNLNDTCIICTSTMDEHTYYQFDCGHKMHKWCHRGYYFFHYDIENNFLRCPSCANNITEQTIYSPMKLCLWYSSPVLVFGVLFSVVYLVLKYH